MSPYWMIVSAALWAASSLLNKAALKCMSSSEVFFAEVSIGLVWFPLIAIWFRTRHETLSFNTRGWLLAMVAAFVAVSASCLVDFVLKKNDLHVISVMTCLTPVLTCILSWTLLGEPTSVTKLLGIGIAVSGIYLVVK